MKKTLPTQTSAPLSDAPGSVLEGKLLIATPSLMGSCFEKSVIYLCKHSEEGAMGIIINHPIAHIDMDDIFSQLKIDMSPSVHEIPIHFGGPVETFRGFVLHSPDYHTRDTLTLPTGISLTANIDILKDVAKGKGPSNSMLALGYAGWGAGQLESELEENSWLISPTEKSLIFDKDDDDKWEKAAATIGVKMSQLSPMAGHA